MEEEDKTHKENNKLKTNTPVGIIPSNYPKSHRLNADLPHQSITFNDQKDMNESISSNQSLNIDYQKVSLDTDDELESDKKTTPRKKNRRNKLKESDDMCVDYLKTNSSQNNEEEPKPRIVLTFRSEKPGLRSSNMKIVSPDEKSNNEETNTRRSARFRASVDKLSTSRIEESDETKSTNRGPRKNFHPQSESDEADNSSVPPLKRSNRRRSKDYSETVLANAIARKEKSYEATPSQRLITRPVKPTAKVLANKELKLSLETTNSTRLRTDKSPEDTQLRRSGRRRVPRGRCSRDNTSSPRKQLQHSKHDKPNKQCEDDSDDEVLKPSDDYLSIDEIKQCIMGAAPPVGKVSLRANDSSTKDRENRRFNKMKKKHLSKLGLQAVLGTKRDMSNSIENLTDDSTLDSTNTDAIVEHLNAQKKQIEEEKENSLQVQEIEQLEGGDHACDEDEDSELMSLLKEGSDEGVAAKRSDSDTSDEEFAFAHCSKPDVGAATPRITRKTARLQQPHDSTHSDHSDGERAECSSPAGGDEGLTAAAPGEGAQYFASCLCSSASNVYLTPDALTEPVFCRAVELVNGARVGCSHVAARDPDGEVSALRRASVRVPYFLACSLHAAKLRRHLCCPVCGIFCTQGTFYQCSEGHLFHLECGVSATAADGDDAPGCPHCGGNPQESVALNQTCVKVRVDVRSSNKLIFMPSQVLQSTPALMTFAEVVEDEGPVPAVLLPRAPVSLTSLRQRGEAAADYEELLTSTPEERLAHAVRSAHQAEDVLTKLMNGVDLHQPLESAEGGTWLHLAATHGNLTAAYLLHAGGCKLDATDARLRTPLMAAVLALADTTKHQQHKSSHTEEETEDAKEIRESRHDLSKGIVEVMKYLLTAGCDVNFQGAEGATALHLAAQHGAQAACEVLLASHRTRVDRCDLGGWTPLVWAAEHRHAAVVRLLLRHGADASTSDAEGNSALHWCALAGGAACLQLLLDAAPPSAVDTANPHGDTPLHVAARQDHYPCAAVLLARGGRTDIKNSASELAVDCARGETRTAISLNMQMSLMAKDRHSRYKLLSSDISNGREELNVSCVNDVDDAALPDDFVYITRLVMPFYIRLHNTLASIQGCACGREACGGAGGGAACSCCVLGVRRWYADGRLVHDFPFRDAPMLFECNETCRCNLKQCPNAVVTRLMRRGAVFARCQVFRCRSPRGWGLRALAEVPRGAPVALYCGELLKASQADKRSKDQYMFAMEVKRDLIDQSEGEPLCVDAGEYGSAARFINHSCRANLAPVRVFTASRDVRAPNIVLFATRNVHPLEELTFNYGDKFWAVKSESMSCCCGASNCRYGVRSPVADR